MKQGTIRKPISMLLVAIMLMTLVSPMLSESVYASEEPDRKNNHIIAPEQIIAGKTFTVKTVGDMQERMNSGNPEPPQAGDRAYAGIRLAFLEYGSAISDYENFRYPDCSATFTPDSVGTYIIEATFDGYEFNDSWATDYTKTHTNKYEVEVLGTILFNSNGGSVVTDEKYVEDEALYGNLPTPKRTGYTFLGWFTKPTGGTKMTAKSEVEFNGRISKTLYAHWGKQMTVSFNANKGKVSTKSKQVIQTAKYGTLPTPKRSKYKFLGWYTKKSGGAKVTSSKTVTNTKNHTLYAHWFGPKGSGKTITKAEYKRIKKGMTMSQVKFLIGGSGKYIGKDGSQKGYLWKGRGSSGAAALIMFKSGKVSAKDQYRLK